MVVQEANRASTGLPAPDGEDYPRAIEMATSGVAEMATQGLVARGRVAELEAEKQGEAKYRAEVMKKLRALQEENARLAKLVAEGGLSTEAVAGAEGAISPGRAAVEEARKELEALRVQLREDGERRSQLEGRLQKEKEEALAQAAAARQAQSVAEARALTAEKAREEADSRATAAERALGEAKAQCAAAEKRAGEAMARAEAAVKAQGEAAAREAAAEKGKAEAGAQVADLRTRLEKIMSDGAAREASLEKAKGELEAREAATRRELERLQTPEAVVAAFRSEDAAMTELRGKYNDDACGFAVYVIRESFRAGILDVEGVRGLSFEDIDVLNERLEAYVPPESEEEGSEGEE